MSDTSNENNAAGPEIRQQPGTTRNSGRNHRGRRNRRFLRIVLGSLVSLFGLAAAAVGAYAYVNHLTLNIPRVHVARLAAVGASPGGPSGQAMNVLIIGQNKPGGSPNDLSGLIMNLHFSANHRTGGGVSIHPFARVKVPGHGRTKIQNALAYGGPALLRRTVTNLTKLKIANTARIDLPHVAAVVDSIHGVTIATPSGLQHFDGAAAISWAKDPALTQEARIVRQLALIRGVATKIADQHLITHKPVLKALISMLTVESDFTFSRLLVLAQDLGSLTSSAATYVIAPYRDVAGSTFLPPALSHSLWLAVRQDAIAGWARTHPTWVPPHVVP